MWRCMSGFHKEEGIVMMWVLIRGKASGCCRNGRNMWCRSHVWRTSQLQCDRSSCRSGSHKHTEPAFNNTPPSPPPNREKNIFKKKESEREEERRERNTENGARTLEPSSCYWNFSGLICINKEAVPCRNVFYPAQKIPGRSLSAEHWENPTVRADKTNESWCQRRVAPRWQIEKNCPSVDRHASFSN